MSKLEKPKFFTTPIWGNISIVISIIACFTFSKYISDTLLVIILSCLVLIFILWNLIKYIINWHKLYKNYLSFYNRFNELDNMYNTRMNEIKGKDYLISEYEKFIENLNIFIIASLTKNSVTETEQLKNMQTFLYLSVEHLKKLKGEL